MLGFIINSEYMTFSVSSFINDIFKFVLNKLCVVSDYYISALVRMDRYIELNSAETNIYEFIQVFDMICGNL